MYISGIEFLTWLTIGRVSGIATKAAIVFSIFSFTNICGYGFMLIFS